MCIYDPTDEQQAIVESDDSALVVAGPGRGKTATAIAAAVSWLARNPGPSRVLFASFSNAAVRRIATVAGMESMGHHRRVHFRTFHSLAMEVLRDFGRFVGLRKPARPLDRTEERIIAAERGWDTGNELTYRTALKEVARDEGRVAFELMVPLASALLRASRTVQRAVGMRFPFIVVDEFQDTRPEHWELLKLVGESSRVVGLGDPNQMIYERQYRAALNRIADFERWKGVRSTQFDGPNFRCRVTGIVQFAEALLHGTRYSPSGSDGVELLAAYPNQRRASLAALWAEIRRQAVAGSTIAFIAPSGATARSLAAELRQPNPAAAVPVPIYAHVETHEGALDAFRLAACAAADWVATRDEAALRNLAVSLAVFSAEWSRKDVTAKRVVNIMKRLHPGSRAKSPVRDYLARATPDGFVRFADGLLTALEADAEFASAGAALRKHGLPRMDALSLVQGSLFDDYRRTRTAAGLEGFTLSSARTTVLSMYRSKGREFDFVVLVVEPRAHSKNVSVAELRRLYYVSATRAREWLGVLHVPGRAGPVLGPVLGE